MKRNPFGDDALPGSKPRVNPFGEEDSTGSVEEAAGRIEAAARKLRGLRTQMGAEGLSIPAQREMVSEMATSLEAAARALRSLAQD